MKNLLRIFIVSAIMMAFAATPLVFAAETNDPSHDFGGSDVYSLNIVATKYGYACKQQVDSLGNPVYGSTVYVPMNGNKVSVMVQSVPGKRTGKIPPLQVIDSCTASLDGSPAVVQIPKNAHGYNVYAKPMGKMSTDPFLTINPPLQTVRDESGAALVYLGELTVNGMVTSSNEQSKRKGQWTQEDISPLLEWSGNVCSMSCTGTCTKSLMCCTPGDPATGKKFGACSSQAGVCPSGTMTVPTYCKSYSDEWILNIPELAQYLSGKTAVGQQLEIEFHGEE